MPISAYAATSSPESGSTINYTFTHQGADVAVFQYGSGDDAFEGTCIEAGNFGESGAGTVTKLSNSSKMVKIAYWYGLEGGWWYDKSEGSGASIIGVSTSYSKANIEKHFSRLQIRERLHGQERMACHRKQMMQQSLHTERLILTAYRCRQASRCTR